MLVGMRAPFPERSWRVSCSMARIIMPEERNLAFKVSANFTPWVSLPDMGRPKMLMEPVPSQVLMVAIFSSMGIL